MALFSLANIVDCGIFLRTFAMERFLLQSLVIPNCLGVRAMPVVILPQKRNQAFVIGERPQTINDVPHPMAVSCREASQMLGVSERTLWKWSKEGRIRCRKVSGRVLFPISSLVEFLNVDDSVTKKAD